MAVLQIAAILPAKGLYSLTTRVASTAPYAPLDDCTQHQCGCHTDKSKRKSCCCFPERNQTAETESPGKGVLLQWVAATHCQGNSQTSLGGITKSVFLAAPIAALLDI